MSVSLQSHTAVCALNNNKNQEYLSIPIPLLQASFIYNITLLFIFLDRNGELRTFSLLGAASFSHTRSTCHKYESDSESSQHDKKTQQQQRKHEIEEKKTLFLRN